MGERRCRYCQQVFQPSKFQRLQAVCSGAECQRKRRAEYHRNKIASDPEYRESLPGQSPKMAIPQSRLLEAVPAEESCIR
jgi:hypothetical protein